MPYIDKKDREELENEIRALSRKLLDCTDFNLPGALNYTITSLVMRTIPSKRYYYIAMVTGVLENVKQEFYRRFAAPYEDEKIAETGDLPEYEW